MIWFLLKYEKLSSISQRVVNLKVKVKIYIQQSMAQSTTINTVEAWESEF